MSKRDNSAELAHLRNRQSSLEQRERECAKSDAQISEKIRRLKKARDAIGDCKSNMNTLLISGYDEQDDELNSAPGMIDDRWYGEKRESYENMRIDTLVEDLEKYYKCLDNIEDDMNNKINDLQKSQFENEGLWGDIKSALYDVGTAIQNFFN